MIRVAGILTLMCLVAPWELLAEPAPGMMYKLYIGNTRSDNLTVVDVATDKIIGSVKVGQMPHGLATDSSNKILYATTERTTNGLQFVDPQKDQVIEEFPIGRTPQELAATPDGRFLYIPSRAECFYDVFDIAQKKTLLRIPVTGHPHNTAVSPDGRFAYLVPYEGGSVLIGGTRILNPPKPGPCGPNKKVYVVDTTTHKVVDTIPTLEAPRPVAMSPDGKRLYVQIDYLMGFLVLDLEKRRVMHRVQYELTPEEIAEPSRCHGIGVAAGGKEVWSTDLNHDLVHVFDVTQDPPKQIAKLKTGREPHWVTVTPDGTKVYVANTSDDTISSFDVATKTEVARIQLPKGMAPKRILVVPVPEAAQNQRTNTSGSN